MAKAKTGTGKVVGTGLGKRFGTPLLGTPKKKFGTALTEYDLERERYEVTNVQDPSKSIVGLPEQKLSEAKREAGYASIRKPTLLADEQKISRKKKKVAGAAKQRAGRLSTILDETLG